MVSSPDCKCDTQILLLPTMKPSAKPLFSTLTNILHKPSTTIVNKNKERGSPFLKPLDAFSISIH